MAKVQYVDIKHSEAAIAFEGIRFHSAYGYVTVFADRSCQPQTGWCLSMDKLGVHVKPSLIDLEARQGDKGQALAA